MSVFQRMEMLVGEAAAQKLARASVAVFGLGGVGSYAAEALARCGIGTLVLVDGDTVSKTNLNRQLCALRSTLGLLKTEVMGARVRDINPVVSVEECPLFYDRDSADQFDFSAYSYLVDAIDTIPSKLLLAERASKANVPLISCMGAANKLDPTRFEVADIFQTSVCPVAKIMRKELKARGIGALKVVYSKEPPQSLCVPPVADDPKSALGSVAFVPSVAGLIMAGAVVTDLLAL